MKNAILQVLNSTPINRQSRVVASQRYCSEIDADASREDLVFSNERLKRKYRLMKAVLRIETKSQHQNVKRRLKAGAKQVRPTRLLEEYFQVAKTIQTLGMTIKDLNESKLGGREARELRQRLGAIEKAWREENPGCIWDGRQLVAPTGETFARSLAAAPMVAQ